MLRQEASTLLAIGGCTSDAMSSFNKQSVKGHNIGVVLLTHGVKGHNICVVLSAREVKGKNIGVVSLAHEVKGHKHWRCIIGAWRNLQGHRTG